MRRKFLPQIDSILAIKNSSMREAHTISHSVTAHDDYFVGWKALSHAMWRDDGEDMS
jgi:hypothetical protein